jgi:hypothetical protein
MMESIHGGIGRVIHLGVSSVTASAVGVNKISDNWRASIV